MKIKHLKPTKWNWVVSYPENLILGNNVDIGCFTYIQAGYGVIIHDNVQIGAHCAIYSEDTERGKYAGVEIKQGAKIGAHTVILPGAIIEENAKIPIGSVVK